MLNGEGHLVESKGQCEVNGACHLINPVVGLEVDGSRAHLGEVLREEVPRGEAKVVGAKVEVFPREAKPPLPE